LSSGLAVPLHEAESDSALFVRLIELADDFDVALVDVHNIGAEVAADDLV
jgi:hypothetical protein